MQPPRLAVGQTPQRGGGGCCCMPPIWSTSHGPTGLVCPACGRSAVATHRVATGAHTSCCSAADSPLDRTHHLHRRLTLRPAPFLRHPPLPRRQGCWRCPEPASKQRRTRGVAERTATSYALDGCWVL